MARKARLQTAGGVYHVFARGVRKNPLFLDDGHYERFLELVMEVIAVCGWRCHTYCLMPNHYHLLIETPEPNLSFGMHRLNGLHAQWFNRRHALEGHVFDRRFGARAIAGDAHLLAVSRYVVLNPVEAGLCRHPAEWRWSSYRAHVGMAKRPASLDADWLLRLFGENRQVARAAYAAFVADGIAQARAQ